MRADAQENRERILAAARTVFAAEGLSVPMREVARHAGIGPATLYRHFPTKELLATAAFADELHACHAIVDAGLAEPDPWQGLCLVVEQLCEMHARNQAFTAAFTSAFPHAIDFADGRRSALRGLTELTRRARDGGYLRPDFVLDDLVLMLMANRGIRAGSLEARVAASRRFAVLALQAFRVPVAVA